MGGGGDYLVITEDNISSSWSHDMQPIPNYKTHARDPKIKEPK